MVEFREMVYTQTNSTIWVYFVRTLKFFSSVHSVFLATKEIQDSMKQMFLSVFFHR